MSKNTPNEIIYIETGYAELKAEIYKRQYKFWSKIIMSIDNVPDNSIFTLYRNAIDKNVQYLKHYKKLHRLYTNHVSCFNEINRQFREKIRNNVTMKAQKTEYNAYYDYILLNNDLVSPTYYSDLNFPECERITLRSRSHLLAMQAGRWGNIIREERNCICKKLQTLYHILFECELKFTKKIYIHFLAMIRWGWQNALDLLKLN